MKRENLTQENDFFGKEKISRILLRIAPPVMLAQLIQALHTISNNVQEMNGARNETLSAIESISDASTQTAECSSSVHSAAGTQLDAIKNLDEASQSLTTKAQSLLDALSTFQV